MNAVVTHSFLGGRRFKAKIEINGKKKKIIASAKDIYRYIKKTQAEQQIFNQFRDVEIKTRDKATFLKQLNCFQKGYYLFVKALFGLKFKDTWENKIIWDRRQISDPSYDEPIQYAWPTLPSIAKNIQKALKVFNGNSCEAVLIDVCAGRGLGFGVGLFTPESAYGSLGLYGQPVQDDMQNYFDCIGSRVFNNPKAIIISLAYSPDVDDYQDLTIPNNISCSVYHMNRKEYEALPRVSDRLTQFMNTFNAKNSV